MRNPERISPIIEKLERIWRAHPDWRFGQLLENTLGGINFYTEDDLTLDALNRAEEMFNVQP